MMLRCSACGQPASPGAKFCRSCGQSLGPTRGGEGPAPPPPPPPSWEWLTLDQVIYVPCRRLGGVGALLALFSAFMPWATREIDLFGMPVGKVGVASPYAWLAALAALAAGLFVFRRFSGSALLVIGVVTAGWAVAVALAAMSGGATPSLGPLLAVGGGGLVAFAGHEVNRQGGG